MKYYRCLNCGTESTDHVCGACGQRGIPIPVEEPKCPPDRQLHGKSTPLFVSARFMEAPTPRRRLLTFSGRR